MIISYTPFRLERMRRSQMIKVNRKMSRLLSAMVSIALLVNIALPVSSAIKTRTDPQLIQECASLLIYCTAMPVLILDLANVLVARQLKLAPVSKDSPATEPIPLPNEGTSEDSAPVGLIPDGWDRMMPSQAYTMFTADSDIRNTGAFSSLSFYTLGAAFWVVGMLENNAGFYILWLILILLTIKKQSTDYIVQDIKIQYT